MYGVENYIKRCLDSIERQTYENYEVIVVDDCTPDKSGEIAEEYCASREKFFYYRNPENMGVSETRNNGFEKVTGDYVFFLDPDDYYEENLLQRVYESLSENEADVVLYGLVEEYRQKNGDIDFTVTHYMEDGVYTEEELKKVVIKLEENTLYGYPWNKAYRVSVLRDNNLKFKKIVHIEDIKFNVEVFSKIKSLNILSDILYHYDQHFTERLTKKYLPDYFELQKERITDIISQLKRWKIYDDDARCILSNIYHRYFVSAIQRNVSAKVKNRPFIKQEMSTELYREFRGCYKANGMATKVLFKLVDSGNIVLNILAAKVIAYVKERHMHKFNKLKQER